MRRSLCISLLAFSAAALAQQQPQQQQQPQPQQQQELDKDTQTRIRVERSAGGLGNITEQEKRDANLGAGPHMERPTSAASREPRAEPEKREQGESAQGNTR